MLEVELVVTGMTCNSCVNRVDEGLKAIDSVNSTAIDLDSGLVKINLNNEIDKGELKNIIREMGYSIEGEDVNPLDFDWKDRGVWKQSAHNTKWCLIGCSIGEFGTLAYYSYSGIAADLEIYSKVWYFFAILPLINGLITSVLLETAILMRTQLDFKNALYTALGMSFISMLMMEIAMEITDLLFTSGELGLMPIAIPFMLLVGFLTPWPYNYWRLKKYGKACH